jgi:2-polyprenyl-3-methyl-5-hydroxy-6-metoxy-1,4-benzoquinol methylase
MKAMMCEPAKADRAEQPAQEWLSEYEKEIISLGIERDHGFMGSQDDNRRVYDQFHALHQWRQRGIPMPKAEDEPPFRRYFIRKYGFAIPCQAMAERLRPHEVLEVGAGAGYLAWEMQQQRVDILATDIKRVDPDDQAANTYKFKQRWGDCAGNAGDRGSASAPKACSPHLLAILQ